MRKVLFGIAVLSALCGAARAAGDDHDSRRLTLGEQRAFFPLVCAHPVAHDKTNNCARVRGYPDTAPVPAGPSSITLDAIAYGAFTRAGADEAYVTYGASFEPHSADFGGGILFARDAGGWRLVRWYRGGRMHPCFAPPAEGGVQKMLCMTVYTGMGETDATIWLVGLPHGEGALYGGDGAAVLSAQDDRQIGAGAQNDSQCTLPREPSEAILLGIHDFSRSRAPGTLAQARVTYAAPRDVAQACHRGTFAAVRESHAIVRFVVRNNRVVALAPVRFAKTDHN
jgi:hypothetical protein